MLSVSAPFPHPGALAFLVPTGEPCRILQQRGDGRVLVSLTGIRPNHPDVQTRASGNRTVSADELAETREAAAEAAVQRLRPRRAKKTARPTAKKARRT